MVYVKHIGKYLSTEQKEVLIINGGYLFSHKHRKDLEQ